MAAATPRRLLLDTHCFLWWAFDDPRLSTVARAAIAEGDSVCFLSAASAWEMAIKISLGKLDLGGELAGFLPQQLAAHRLQWLPIELPHTLGVAALPWRHRDPFDRLLVAQAQVEGLTLVSADAAIQGYEVPCLW
ncbi:MAG: type II toxin-antitoxin system VapC family toxin [Roseateles sp.]|uniref:type II toxin-antitoxin system VapC family toxin n=1 Tax=Roseateles sp. TaxID=1971397 RepID=UPI004035A718